jgi:hypothetical protein
MINFKKDMTRFKLIQTPQRVIVIRPVSLYYAVEKLVALNELCTATYID